MAERKIRYGNIVLVEYPYTNLSAAKVRPALILTPDRYLEISEDALCLFISSSFRSEEIRDTDFVLTQSHTDFVRTGLTKSSLFRAHKLMLLHRSLFRKVLGDISPILESEIKRCLRLALNL